MPVSSSTGRGCCCATMAPMSGFRSRPHWRLLRRCCACGATGGPRDDHRALGATASVAADMALRQGDGLHLKVALVAVLFDPRQPIAAMEVLAGARDPRPDRRRDGLPAHAVGGEEGLLDDGCDAVAVSGEDYRLQRAQCAQGGPLRDCDDFGAVRLVCGRGA